MKTKGVTLIELMIAITMISILTIAAIPMYHQYIQRAQISSILAESRKILLDGMRLMSNKLSCTPSTSGILTSAPDSLIDQYYMYTPTFITPPMCIIKVRLKNTTTLEPPLRGKLIQYELREFLSSTYREYCFTTISDMQKCYTLVNIDFNNTSGPLSALTAR